MAKRKPFSLRKRKVSFNTHADEVMYFIDAVGCLIEEDSPIDKKEKAKIEPILSKLFRATFKPAERIALALYFRDNHSIHILSRFNQQQRNLINRISNNRNINNG